MHGATQPETPPGASSHAGLDTTPSLHASNTPTPIIPDHELIRRIGGGSYGEVWLARNVLGEFRAVKVVYRRTFDHDRPYEREFEGIKKYEPVSRTHDSQVDILHVGRNDEAGYFYYVMELADDAKAIPNDECRNPKEARNPNDKTDVVAGNLRSSGFGIPSSFDIRNSDLYIPRTLKHDLRQRGRLPFEDCVQIGLALTTALDHLHKRGLVHRDVKPSNIIFINGIPKLADIGLVTVIGEAKSLVGTEGYIAPEGPGTPQADVYSLGKVLYELSMGRKGQIFPELPPDWDALTEKESLLELNEVILKACQADLRVRYQSAREMHADLALLQSGKSVKRLRVVEHRLVLATRLGFAVGALMIIAVGAYLFQRWQTRQVAQEKKRAERLLYVADMNLAHQAFEAGNVVRAKSLLNDHRPKPGSDDLRGFEWYHVNYLCRDDPAKTFRGHDKPVNSVAISPDGKLVASGSADNRVKLWNLQSEGLVATLVGHSNSVNGVAFSPDGQVLVSGSSDHTINLWSLSTHQIIAAFTNHTDAVNAVTFSPDGRWLASGSDDRTVRLWDLSSHQELCTFTNHTDRVKALSFSRDGRQLASSSWDTRVIIYDVVHRQPMASLYDQAGWIPAVAFSPDGKTLVSTMGANLVSWDLDRRKVLARLKGHSTRILSVAFSTNGAWLATASDDTTVRLWDTATWQPRFMFKGHKGAVASAIFSPDGQTLISGGRDGAVKAWSLSALRECDVLRGHSDGVHRLALSPDDKMLASASWDHTVKLWEVESGWEMLTLTGHTAIATGVAFAPDGQTLYSCSLDRSIREWDLRTGKQVATFAGHTRPVWTIALSPDGSTLVSGSGWWEELFEPSELIFWDVLTHKPLTNMLAHQAKMGTIQFFPDGKTVVTSGHDGQVKLWDVASRQAWLTLTNRAAAVVSPDGRLLAMTGPAEEIEIWDVSSRRITVTLPSLGPEVGLYAMAFAPDGKRLAAYYENSQVKLWDLETRRDTATFSGHDTFGFSVVFTRDGETMATSSFDSTIRLWRAPRLGLRSEGKSSPQPETP